MIVGFTVLVITHGTVNFRYRLGWHQLLQKQHISRWNARVYQKIRTRKTEHHADLVSPKEHGVHVNRALLIMKYRQNKGHRLLATDDTAYNVGALVTKKMVLQYLKTHIFTVEVEPWAQVGVGHNPNTGNITL